MYNKLCVIALFCALAQLSSGMMLGGYRVISLTPIEMEQQEVVAEKISAQYNLENLKLECAERQVIIESFSENLLHCYKFIMVVLCVLIFLTK